MSGAYVPRAGSSPHRGMRAGALVVADGRVWILLGCSPTGAWAMIPPETFGTAAAKRSIYRTLSAPTALPRRVVGFVGPARDRRGGWKRG